uniref:SSD domain-containing protein n=1 Tax=Syphacia muris TaxID=451379 RepID=A0A0N5ARR3_9BILA
MDIEMLIFHVLINVVCIARIVSLEAIKQSIIYKEISVEACDSEAEENAKKSVLFQICTALTILCSLKLAITEPSDNIRTGYTPRSARAFDELNVFKEFNDGQDPLVVFVFITARDGGSLLRLDHLNATLEIVDHIDENIAVKNLSYQDICDNFCMANEPIRQFRNGLLIHQEGRFDDNDFLNLSYPIMRFFGRDLDLSSCFFGVTTVDSNSTNSTGALINRTLATNIASLKLILLQFRAKKPESWGHADWVQWERSIYQYIINEYNGTLLKPYTASLIYTQDEVVRAGMALHPYLVVGFIVMISFSLITVYIGAIYNNQWTVHKISYAIFACICPLMATATALGLLLTLGLRFGSILAVTPFLVLAIGVDDAYLMINSWNIKALKRRSTSVEEHRRERITEVLVDIGPSITITSLTNMLAFGIGTMSPTPEIQLLCIANTVALFFDWVYTITIYAAIMCIHFKHEIKSEIRSMPTTVNKTCRKAVQYFLDSYCEWLSSGFTSFVIILLLCVYWFISIKAALTAHAGLTPDKLFLSNSPMLEVNKIVDEYTKRSYSFVTVYITKCGNMSDPMRVSRMKDLVSELEGLPETNGPLFTKFWIRDYESFLEAIKEDVDDTNVMPYSAESIKQFVSWPEYSHWGGFMKFNESSHLLSQFFFTTVYHGRDQSEWNTRLHMLKSWRAIVDRYKDIGASVYEDDSMFVDQIESLVPTTIQTSIMTLACMAVVCCIFMSNVLTVTIAVTSILSICLGVFGLITLWGIDIDPISVATLIMSIGLSVDFPAHLTFHFYRTGLSTSIKSSKDRLMDTLSFIGFPLLQCSMSTILLVCSLLFVSSYMTEVFSKTIVLVITLGTIHALIAVPAILCLLSNIYRFFNSCCLRKTAVGDAFRDLEKQTR